jgi:DNA mismatch repair protein MutS
MQADKTTLADLAIFHPEEERSIFTCIDYTQTTGGREWLRFFLAHPLDSIQQITDRQKTIQSILAIHQQWKGIPITNGTIMVVEKYFETQIDEMPAHPDAVSSLAYSIFHAPDFSLIKYTVKHFADFFAGLQQIIDMLHKENNPIPLQNMLERIEKLLQKSGLQKMLQESTEKKSTKQWILTFGHFLLRRYKQETLELIEIYSKLDAWYSMAVAGMRHQFCFPTFIESEVASFSATQLFHPLLAAPVAYDVALLPHKNFLFLTGANMGGKSTFIKAAGVAVYLAHTGMGVPAQQMELSLLDGLLSNINVEDNLAKGESYFFNEVQRIKSSVAKIADGRKWLILIDELFKGTNVQDAMKCSETVVVGLVKIRKSVFILSTHLYEIGPPLKKYPNIIFNYFETAVVDGQLLFNYQLKEGISNDRLGYLILKKEGVVDMLQKL